MVAIPCFLGRLRKGTPVPELPMLLDGSAIEAYFAHYSADRLDLRITSERADESRMPDSRPTDALSLHEALASLLPAGASGSGKPEVGVIYADVYESHRGTFGMMFDLGFDPTEILGPVPAKHHKRPRQGCAVFVGEISQWRHGDQDRRTETAFTTVHELGHLFNLWHYEKAPNFMKTSALDAPFSTEALFFRTDHSRFLKEATDPRVLPGGKSFGERGADWPNEGPFLNRSSTRPGEPRRDRQIRLRLRLSQESLWFFEPVELEIEITSARRSPVRLPDQLDPGYPGFDIWLEEPDGTRRRYKPANHYCPHVRSIEVAKGRPFRRDISLFGQSGGYTFRMPGIHRVQAVWAPSTHLVLRSDWISFEVRAAPRRRSSYERLRKALTEPGTARFLFYRSTRHRQRQVELWRGFRRAFPGTDACAGMEYALGRYLATRAGRIRSPRTETQKEAREHLMRAMDVKALGRHRRRKAQRLLQDLA